MTDLLESRWLWGGLGWLCLLAFALWLSAVLFPLPGESSESSLDDTMGPREEHEAPTTGQATPPERKESR